MRGGRGGPGGMRGGPPGMRGRGGRGGHFPPGYKLLFTSRTNQFIIHFIVNFYLFLLINHFF